MPPPSRTSAAALSFKSMLAKLIDPTNEAAPTVDVPTPRCTCRLSMALAKSPKFAK